MAKKEGKHNIGAGIVRALMYPFAKMPLRWHYFFAGFIAWLLRAVLHYRQDVIYTNLAKSFPDKSYAWIRKTAGDFYRHLAEMIVEAIWFSGCRNPERLRKAHIVELVNPELIQEAYENSPSVMVLDTHCGNWELLGGLFFYNFKDCECPIKPGVLHVVYKALKNKTWDKVFYENRRCPTPDTEGQIEASGMLRFIAGHRREKYIYLVNNDQFPRESSCEVGTFLNQPTTGFVGAATLASRLKLSVLYMGMVNDRRGHYSIRFERICDDASLMTPEEITRRYYDLLEKDIKETPHNWLWSHKRWKNIK